MAGVAVSASASLGPAQTGLFLSLAILGSLLPDIDHTESKLGRRIRPISFVITKIFGHRTLTHSLTLYFFLSVLGYFAFPQYQIQLLAIVVGAISHLLLDSLNPSGVPLFYPHPARFSIAKIRTGSLLEHVFLAVMLFAAGYVYFAG